MLRTDQTTALRRTIGLVVKTTLYLPDDLRGAIKSAAARHGASEADIIRDAITAGLNAGRPRPRGALFTSGAAIAARTDHALSGFGTT